ncbi:MAG: sigma factor-like helix-turn-helix DNA-binding protein [Acidimicrobiales bacterium]
MSRSVDDVVVEIAKEIGVPAGTARSWLHRARRAMAAELAWDIEQPPVRPGDIAKEVSGSA